MTTKKAKRRLSGFDFSGDDAAVALVNSDQGGGANGYQTLITKATDVTVSLSMAEFLTRFTDMWSSDAQMVSNLLGYSDDVSALWDGEELVKRVTLVSKASAETPTNELLDTLEVLSKATNVQISDLQDIRKNISGVTTENNEETPQDEVIKMADNTVEKPVDLEQVLKAKEAEVKAQAEVELQKALEKQKQESEAIQKGLEKQLEEFQKAQAEREKAEHVELAKAYQGLGVTEDKQVEMAVALMKMKGDSEMKVVLDVLDKAKNIQKAASEGIFEEQGHNVEPEEATGVSGVMKALQATNKTKA